MRVRDVSVDSGIVRAAPIHDAFRTQGMTISMTGTAGNSTHHG